MGHCPFSLLVPFGRRFLAKRQWRRGSQGVVFILFTYLENLGGQMSLNSLPSFLPPLPFFLLHPRSGVWSPYRDPHLPWGVPPCHPSGCYLGAVGRLPPRAPWLPALRPKPPPSWYGVLSPSPSLAPQYPIPPLSRHHSTQTPDLHQCLQAHHSPSSLVILWKCLCVPLG